MGITEYLTPGLPPIKGTVKARYGDFIVNEIDKMGQLSYISKAETKKVAPAKPKEEEKAPTALSEDTKAKIKDAMKATAGEYQGMIEFMEHVLTGVEPKDSVHHFPCTAMGKAERTAFHQVIKQHCPQFETNTV